MSVIKLVQGDNRPYIKLTLTNADQSIVDVSDAIVVVKFRAANSEVTLSSIVCSKPNGGEDGIVVFNFPGNTLNVPPGQYEGEIEITFAAGDVQTLFSLLQFTVREQFV